MKRFYAAAAVAEAADGHGVELDGRPLRTPAGRALRVPSRRLAEAIAEEWQGQDERLVPRAMKLTGLANAAIDRVAPDPEAFAAGLLRYGETDLLCYRATGPAGLAARQAEHWDPVLAWARRRHGAELAVARGIVHAPQPPAALERLGQAVRALDPFALAALSPLVTISGSLLIGLALADGRLSADAAWEAATLDEQWQAERWGEDQEAARALAARRSDFAAAARFLALLGDD